MYARIPEDPEKGLENSMGQYVHLEKKDGIAYVTMDRQEALNALSGEVMDELDAVVTELEQADDVFCMILTGAGRAFVAGADIGAQADFGIPDGRAWGQRGAKLFRRIENLEFPTIAAVNGFALGGGCELAMTCDIIIASEKAKFGQPEVGLGIIPGFSGTQRLPRRVGIGMAKELIYTGKMIRADEAQRIGLVNAVYAPEELMPKAEELAKEIMKNGPIAVKYAKAAINRGIEMDIESGILLENELFAMSCATEDHVEGMHAFLEKRPAVFKNK